MSWEEFLEEFKKRHPKEYGLSNGSIEIKAPMVKEAVKAPEKAVSVAPVASVDDGWDAIEIIDDDEPDEYWK